MAIKIHYQYTVYQGCDEATEKSKKWERARALSWGVWCGLGCGTLCGATAISQLITNNYNAESFWPMVVFFVVGLFIAYSHVFRSKYVYPTCEELFLASKKTETNHAEIDVKISEISYRKWKNIKIALIKFSAIYFPIFIALAVFYSFA